MRSQSSPEVYDVFFEESSYMSNCTSLGFATRIFGGWELTGLSLPFNENRYVRARGRVYGGYYNGSNYDIESGRLYYNFPTYNLSVTKSGTGSGTVLSSPAGINCGTTCSADFPTSTLVTLTAIEDSNSYFAGFTGDCNSQGEVLVNGNKNCVAIFNLKSPSEVGGSSNPITISKGSRTSVVINYTPANCTTDHSVYWG